MSEGGYRGHAVGTDQQAQAASDTDHVVNIFRARSAAKKKHRGILQQRHTAPTSLA